MIRTLILTMASVAAFAAETPIGFIARISGKGYILRGERTLAASGMDVLYASDRIKTANGAVLRINICPKGYEIRGESDLTISGGLNFKKGAIAKTFTLTDNACTRVLSVLTANSTPEVAARNEGDTFAFFRSGGERSGVTVVRGGRRTIGMISSMLLPQRPFIMWDAVSNAQTYQLRIMNGAAKVIEATVRENCYRPAVNSLDRNTGYRIQIEAMSAENVIKKGEHTLAWYDAEKAKQFNSDEASIGSIGMSEIEAVTMLGRLYESYGLIADAVAQYEKVRKLDAESSDERLTLLKNYFAPQP